MLRPVRVVLALASAGLSTACGDSGSGGGGAPGADPLQQVEIDQLRLQIFIAAVEPVPEPPPVSDELFALGQALFFDKILSGSEDVACATCHLPEFATADGRTLGDGVGGLGFGPDRGGGTMLARNTPALFAAHAKDELFWDGHVREVQGVVVVPPTVHLDFEARSTFSAGLELLAAQAMLPPVSRAEMRGEPGENPLGGFGDGYDGGGGGDETASENTALVWRAVNERLLALPGYRQLLRAAYPDVRMQDFTFAHAANAIAAFEARAFARTDSSLDRFLRGDDAALTRAEVRGGLEFFRAGCGACHSGPLLSDQQFHNVGLPQLGPGMPGSDVAGDVVVASADLGREATTGLAADRFRFRTPSLLNVAVTAPYGHAGQFTELRDMVAHFSDVAASHLAWDVGSNVIDPELVDLVVSNADEVLAALDPLVQAPNDFDVEAVLTFLGALTADGVGDLGEIVPLSVPSGLPIF